MVANEISSEDAEEYDVNTPRGDDTPKAPPKGYRTYRTQKVEITDKKKGNKTPDTPAKRNGKSNTRGFRPRGNNSSKRK